MKKFIFIAALSVLLTGCGVGSYSVQSGIEDAAYISFTDDVVSFIAKEGFDVLYGARPLRRAIQSKIEDMLSDEMLLNNLKKGDAKTVCLKLAVFV